MRPKPKNPFVIGFKLTAKDFVNVDLPKVLNLRGNPSKRALLIAPPPDAQDCKSGLPLSNETYAKEFHLLMNQYAGLNTEHDFVVMAGCPLLSARATKKAIEPFRELLLEHRDRFDLVVCIGGNNFKFYFGRGKKSSLQTLANGSPVFLTFDWAKLPLFVLPDIQALSPEWTNDNNQDWKLQLAQEQCHKWLVRVLPGLQTTYARYVK